MSTDEIDGFATLTLTDGRSLEATFVPGVGNVVASLRDRGQELLGPGKGLRRYAEAGSTMGIPLLHPWANRLSGETYEAAGRRVTLPPSSPLVRREEHGLPIHGLLGGWRHWEVQRSGEGALHAELDFAAFPELLAAFPFPHRLTVDATLFGGTLTMRTTLHATGDVPVPVAFGYHPYLVLPDVPRAEWRVALPAMRHLELDGQGIPTGRGERHEAWTGELGERTFDDGYADVEPGAVFALVGGGRRIEVAFEEGYAAAQVFAPPTADVVCFEPMTAPANALISRDRLSYAPPGGRSVATFSVTVDRDVL